jgi:DNA-binding MarR family transcriptional regulator
VPSNTTPADGETVRLGHLLKQAHHQFMEQATKALAPLGIGTREWAALLCLDDERNLSQGAVAQRLGVDRTTMVALVDALQQKGLVAREPDPADRRKNRVVLTPEGRRLTEQGAELADEVERRFLAALSPTQAQQLKSSLQVLLAPGS